MNSKFLKSGHIKLYKRENSNYWQMKIKLPKLKAIRSSTGTKIIKDAKKIAIDYQNRNLFKSVFELALTSGTIGKKRLNEIREEISKRSKVDIDEIFVDSSNTPSIPLSPSKKESKSIILLEEDNNRTKAKEIQISNIQLVSVMSGFMKILRVYTPSQNRKKVEIAAKSILGDLK